MALSEPGHDKRFYGVYRGQVVDNADPLKKGRVKVKVPQILGSASTTWAPPVSGGPQVDKVPYGSFYDSTTQVLAATNTPQVVTINNTALGGTGKEEAYDVYIKDGRTVVYPHSGTYSFTFSIQVTSNNTSIEQARFWLKAGGVNYPDSASEIQLPARKNSSTPARGIVTVNFMATAAVNQEVEIWWEGTASIPSTMYLETFVPSAAAPEAPSVILTTNLVGSYTPLPGENVWVMFEGGDPNFPLWLGAF